MTKTELMETYTAEQLAEMVVNLQNDIKLKVGESGLPISCDALKCKCDKCGNEFIAVLDSDYELVKRNCEKRKGENMNISDIQKCQEEYEKLLKENPLHGTIDKICKDILEQKNNAMAMEFTRIIRDLLKRYGVYVHCTETKFGEKITVNSIEEQYGVAFDSMDFSKHDKEFMDRIKELEEELEKSNREHARTLWEFCDSVKKEDYDSEVNRLKSEVEKYRKAFEDAKKECDCQVAEYRKKIKELENRDIAEFLPTEPIKVAEMLINAEGEYKHNPIEKKICGTDKGTYCIFDISELRQIAEHLLVYCNHNGEDN